MASGQDKEELPKVVEELGEDKEDEGDPLLPIEVVIDPQVTFSPYSPMSREGDTNVWPFVKPPSTPPPGLAKCQQI